MIDDVVLAEVRGKFTAWAYVPERDLVVHRRMVRRSTYQGADGDVYAASFADAPEMIVLCAGPDHAPLGGWNYLHSGWAEGVSSV